MNSVRFGLLMALLCCGPVLIWTAGQLMSDSTAASAKTDETLRTAVEALWLVQACAAALMATMPVENDPIEHAQGMLAFWLVPLPLLTLVWAGGAADAWMLARGLAAALAFSSALLAINRGLGRISHSSPWPWHGVLSLVLVYFVWRFDKVWLGWITY
ncbi:hypothetical protein EVC37_00150 [Methylocaldum sp. BRCS4]|jgi:hypothetical protein|uniref:hypothetical protein n=1 Tax=Methylocaldum sp. GT1BB TaxID=3438963 RepID=UPI0012ECAA99|nr:hypothetical protein [Methylocaldum sp. BRCS4]